MKKYAIFGAGNLAISFVKGMLKKGISPKQILMIISKDSKRDLKFFTERGITVSCSVKDIPEGATLLFLVKPTGSGYILDQLSKISISVGQEIISMVSGLGSEQIRKVVLPGCRIIIGTTNTNIAYCKGVIAATAKSELFENLGVFIEIEEEALLNYIIGIGTNNALFAQAILLCYKENSAHVSMKYWIQELKSVLVDAKYKGNIPAQYTIPLKYLRIVTEIFCNEPFFYRFNDARILIYTSIISTCDALIEMEVLNESAIKDFIRMVATKNGCTEKGINKTTSVEQLTNQQHVADEVFMPIVIAGGTFQVTAKESIECYKPKLAV
jgi:pyrroline-5-carboxylate reductase